ncbi:MAG TPA: LptE family protein [bacterium]|nr:LptE family protein [bacterium]HQL63257.1 LptE family protein [bacterium]
MNRYLSGVVVFIVLTAVSCSTTHETVLGEEYGSIAIPVFKNETMEPGLEETITASVIQSFLRDRRLRVTDRSHADVVLEGRITSVEIEPLSFTDLDRAVGYDMTLVLRARMVDADDGRIVMEETEFQTRGPFLLTNEPTIERQRDIGSVLADQIISRFLDGW